MERDERIVAREWTSGFHDSSGGIEGLRTRKNEVYRENPRVGARVIMAVVVLLLRRVGVGGGDIMAPRRGAAPDGSGPRQRRRVAVARGSRAHGILEQLGADIMHVGGHVGQAAVTLRRGLVLDRRHAHVHLGRYTQLLFDDALGASLFTEPSPALAVRPRSIQVLRSSDGISGCCNQVFPTFFRFF